MLGPLDMFGIGIGPSSSHTIGPMKAAVHWVNLLEEKFLLQDVNFIKINLYGSLALTGEGHGTLLAVINGLEGYHSRTISSEDFLSNAKKIKEENKINLAGRKVIDFNYSTSIILNKTEFLKYHANGIRFSAYNSKKEEISKREYFSIGGGFIQDEEDIKYPIKQDQDDINIPYPFKNATELFSLCEKNHLTIAQLVIANELVKKEFLLIKNECIEIIKVMRNSIQRGLVSNEVLPGGLKVKRRAPALFSKLKEQKQTEGRLFAITYAMAVNEENAGFGKVVTAPTNGSAGTIPAVLEYFIDFCENSSEDKQIEFILTAGAIGMLYKFCASISAAEVGCQGEIGVACSMAAAALTAVLGGNLIQIEKAAEIAMEHHLGMTCDPINGLVQIPCIERNGVAASRAIDIAQISLLEDKRGIVSLDEVIKTMLQTGKDMSMKYKETALGGLAVNVVNC